MASSIKLKNDLNTEMIITHKDGLPSREMHGSDMVIAVDTIDDMKALANPYDGMPVFVRDKNRGGNFVYDSAKVSEDNGGTNFVGYERMYNGAVNVKWFGAAIDKTIIKAAIVSNSENKKLIFEPINYTLSGDKDLVFNTSIDFNNANFIIDGFSGKIIISDNAQRYNLSSGSLFDKIASRDFVKNSTNIGDFDDNIATDLDDSFIKINTSKVMLKYRDNDILYREFTRFLKYGYIENPILTNFAKEDVTSIDVIKLSSYKSVENLTVTLANTVASVLFEVRTSNTNIDGIKFQRLNDAEDENISLIRVIDSYNVKLNNCDLITNKNSNDEYTYSLDIQDSLNTVVDGVFADGKGWGSTGNNMSRNVEFRNSTLSRIDFHTPFLGALKVYNCKLANNAITVVGFGDLHINSVNIKCEKGIAPRIVSTRGDSGGIINGNLYISDVKLISPSFESYNPAMLLCAIYDDDNGAVDGGVMTNNFFDEIYMNNTKFDVNGSQYPMLIKPYIDGKMNQPSKIVLNNVTSHLATDTLTIDIDKFIPSVTQDNDDSISYECSVDIDIDDCSFGRIMIGSQDREDYALNVNVKNINTQVLIYMRAMGYLTVQNCNKLVAVDMNRAYRTFITLFANTFIGRDDMLINIPKYNSRFVKVFGNNFNNVTDVQLLNLLTFNGINRNTFLDANTYYKELTLTDDNNNLIDSDIASGFPIIIVTGDGDNVRYEHAVMPKKGKAVSVSTTTSTCKIVRNDDDDNTLTIDSPDDVFRRIDTMLGQ